MSLWVHAWPHQFFQNFALSSLVSLVVPVFSVLCTVGDRFLLVNCLLSGSLGVSCGEKSSVLLVWPCGRQLVDGFCSLGSPFLRKENFCLSFSGDFSCLPTASQEFFLAFGNLAPSPVRVKSADGFWHSQMSLLLRKAVFVSQFGFLKLSCSPLVPFFNRAVVSP